ncbi:MAG: DNA/RNA nuclease SfsA [Halobacteriovoraceae bacterium]|nr:DNA/RNA nuclease SfsA [Halobacteriovoraceae bacterium]
MEIENPQTGIITKRYKRFLADVIFENDHKQTIYVPNTGSMESCWAEGWKIVASFKDDPKRKYAHTLELTHNGETWIGVNTNKTNDLVYEALKNKTITELKEYENITREYKIGKSRLDFKLENSKNEPFYLEVKNVTLKKDGAALFPDSISTRGHKHLRELIGLVEKKQRAGLLFVVQREDVQEFNAFNPIDSTYTELLYEAKKKGVIILAYQCQLHKDKISIYQKLPIIFPKK